MSRYRSRRPGWHDPEHLPGQADRDSALGRTRFYVYVLETRAGHYVGHTWNVRSRVRQHVAGAVPSTAGLSPRLLWQSGPLSTREEAARFEAALKSMRDQKRTRYAEIVGFDPVPFVPRPRPVGSGSGWGCALWLAALGLLAAFVLFAALAG